VCVCVRAGWRVVVGDVEGGEWWEVGGGGGGRRRERWGRRRLRGGEVRVAAAAAGLSTHVGARTVEPLSTLGFVNVVARTSTLQR
jgi:hypothetical protein